MRRGRLRLPLPGWPFRRRQAGGRARRPAMVERRAGAPLGRQYGLGIARTPEQPRRRFSLPWRRIAWSLGALLVAASLAGGAYWLLQGDTLRVQRVTVIGAQAEDPHAVAGVADLGGRSLLLLDLEGVATLVERMPGVRSAEVVRDWPDGVVIDVVEHQGWGYWQAGGRRHVIDSDGMVLGRGRPPRDGAPTIIELDATRALEPGARTDRDTVQLVDRLQRDGSFERLGVEPERFEFRQDRGLTVRIAEGPDAVFGDSHSYEFKVAAWGALLERLERESIAAEEIDLRFGQQLVLR